MRGQTTYIMVYNATEMEVIDALEHWQADIYVRSIESEGNNVVVKMKYGSTIWDEDDVLVVLREKFGKESIQWF